VSSPLTAAYSRLRSLRWDRDYALIGSLYALFYGSGVAWLSFFSIYLQQMGLSGLQIGAVSGIRPAAMLLSQPLWGLLADTRGRRKALLLTTASGAFFLLGYTWGSGFWFFFAWTILYTVTANPTGALLDSLALDYVEQHAGQSFGMLRIWGAAGWAVFSFVTGQLVSGRSLQLAFLFGAGLLLIGTVLVWSTGPATESKKRSLAAWQGAATLLHNRKLLIILSLAALMQVGISSFYTFFSIYLAQLQASRQLIGMAYTLQGLSELPVFLASAAIIRRIGARGAITLGILTFAARLLLYSIITQPLPAIALSLTHGLSFSIFLVAIVGYVSSQVPAELRATGQSLFWAAFFGAGAIVGNAWAGFLFDRVGVQPMFALNGGLLFLVGLAAALVVGR
jgi:MFS transporter, PPP family, 3-phenylpropionic acid transporter